jgi:hypothetical protein
MKPLNEAELDALAQTLRAHTPLGRVNHVEANVVLAKLAELGLVIAKPAGA